jgi:hypothetical protein
MFKIHTDYVFCKVSFKSTKTVLILRQDVVLCDVGAEVEERVAHWPSSMIEYKHGGPKFKA